MSENSSARTWVIDPDSAEMHEREPFGDASGMDAGAVEGRPGGLGDGVEGRPLGGVGVEPPERRDHVLAGLRGCASTSSGSANSGL